MKRKGRIAILTVIILFGSLGILTQLERILPERVKTTLNPRNGKPWYGLCPVYAATTVEEFRRQVERDPVLKRHYADFDWDNAEVIEVEETVDRHVMYRKYGMLAWTGKTITIKKGEKLITDGNRTVRTYCCNEIAEIPKGPVLVEDREPKEEELSPPDTPPEIPPVTPPEDPIFPIPPFDPPFTPVCLNCGFTIPPPRNPPVCEGFTEETPVEDVPDECVCQVFPVGNDDRPEACEENPPGCIGICDDIPPLDPVPEPSTWILFGTGTIVAIYVARRKKKHESKVSKT